jgi:hyperosmotically inducible protein
MRALFRLLLIIVILALAGFYLLGYRPGSFMTSTAPGSGAVIDTEKARERGAELGEKGAIAAARIRDSVSEASITGKIKAKMALDDTIQARRVDVTTEGRTVTVSGSVRNATERARVLALARETEGVATVIDRLDVK